MAIGTQDLTTGSTNELSFIVRQLGNAEGVEDCIEALQTCFDHFQLADYILIPNSSRLLPIVSSRNPAVYEVEKRLEAQRQSGAPILSSQSVPQFPFKASELKDADSLMPDPSDLQQENDALKLTDTYVLPVQGDEEKALLFIWDDFEDLAEARMLALQAICTNSIKRMELLQRQHQEDGLLAPLSQIELSLLKGMASGRRQDEIAQDYGLSPQTISLFSNQITKKLGASSLRQAISMTSKSPTH